MLEKVKKSFNHDTQRNQYKNFIEYIRFPFYKNFESNLKLNFTFPITFLVGQNGTGKSSLLQALYGSPEGKSVGDFWFNTELDPIKENANEKNCLIYSYITEHTNTQVEILKTRAHRANKLDYWEPARPKVSLDMQKFSGGTDPREFLKTRWKPLQKKVFYLDFRYEISAFDKYFYFGTEPSSKTMHTKQDLIRRVSPILKSSHISKIKGKYYTRTCSRPIILTTDEINVISKILGKKYIHGEIIEHDLYEKGKDGFSIILKTDFSEYSEAFAGSGESAVVKLVHEIINAPKNSLILLDEPETSLHPGAQQELINFLLEETLKKKLQVVISTHSSNIITSMPKEAIKVLVTNNANGKTEIIENIQPEEAFFYIGEIYTKKKCIIVEDLTAKMIVDAVLKDMGKAVENLIEVKFYPGGVSAINQKLITVYSQEWDSIDSFIFFDGDQTSDHIDPSDILDRDQTKEKLKVLIKAQTNHDIKFLHDSGREDQEIRQMLDFLNYYLKKVFYLPENIPEEIIWNDDLLENPVFSDVEKEAIRQEESMKMKYALYSKTFLGNDTADEISMTHQYFIQSWIKQKNENYESIKSTITLIKNM